MGGIIARRFNERSSSANLTEVRTTREKCLRVGLWKAMGSKEFNSFVRSQHYFVRTWIIAGENSPGCSIERKCPAVRMATWSHCLLGSHALPDRSIS